MYTSTNLHEMNTSVSTPLRSRNKIKILEISLCPFPTITAPYKVLIITLASESTDLLLSELHVNGIR